MRLYGHVARFPAGDPAGRILSAREPAGRTCPVGHPYDTWLRQMDRHFVGVGMGRVEPEQSSYNIQLFSIVY